MANRRLAVSPCKNTDIAIITTQITQIFNASSLVNTPEEFKPTLRALLEKKLQYVNESLKDEQWIGGSRFTIADAYLFTVLRWARAVKLNLEGLDHLASYMKRVSERPAVAAALKAEGLN